LIGYIIDQDGASVGPIHGLALQGAYIVVNKNQSTQHQNGSCYMIALVQRVREASVMVDGQRTGAIGRGLLVLLGVHKHDTEKELDWVVRKCANLRVFPDEAGKMNRSVLDMGGEALVVSQFTLYGNVQKGNRPSYNDAALPEKADALYEQFVQRLSGVLGRPVPTGIFGAMMDVRLLNEGPVTIWIERPPG
jgi:D-tyrosyl-tRNA(Tyr) deacylase